MKKDVIFNLSFSAFLGASIWALSPSITGYTEPWDAKSAYYYVALFIAGALVAIPGKRPLWAVYIGVILGQFLYVLLFLSFGPLLPVGIVFLAAYSLLSLLAALIIQMVFTNYRKYNKEGKSNA